MLKNIKTIKNMAVYADFDWSKSVRDKGNNVVSFKKLNIIYGRNYSGKTTLSRIIRALETGFLSEKYVNAEFAIEIDGKPNSTHSELRNHAETIRVFNDDFVRDNLRFITNPEESIKSFAILGDDNNKVELEIAELVNELGSEDAEVGLLGQLKKCRLDFDAAARDVRNTASSLETKLFDKANKASSGIKHNKLYGHATYNIQRLKEDIAAITQPSYGHVTEQMAERLKLLLKEDVKPTLSEVSGLDLQFQYLSQKAKTLVEKRITVSEPIQALLNDELLQGWVRTGKALHEGKREHCGFCGSPLPSDLMDRLNKHFNIESEDLRRDLELLLDKATDESNRIHSLISFDSSTFYANFSADINRLKIRFNAASKKYEENILHVMNALNLRLRDVFAPNTFQNVENVAAELDAICAEYNALIRQCNDITASFTKKQQEARTALRQHDVATFINDIKYADELLKIDGLKTIESAFKDKRDEIQLKVTEARKKIDVLRAQLKDESKGAERVNTYLNDFFGHESLSLKAVENELGYRFEVMRKNQKAHHLSEGECSLLAFCYFMAKLEDVETRNNSPIVWIDDPICSLDLNHIFFVFSLINSKLSEKSPLKQLLVSTHNLDFLKYLKRLPGANKNTVAAYFICERSSSGSQISVMPDYLKAYVTEFNYLFHQIYKCANADVASDIEHDCYYNFGNNTRKFLEAFLYYKYPNAKEKDDKIGRFFGSDPLATSLINRVSNEYSHLDGAVERSIIPIDVPEMKKLAQYILQKIEENDIDQYDALLESIGVAVPSKDAAGANPNQAAIPRQFA
jgi:wobble nucleotide-excising tRNase